MKWWDWSDDAFELARREERPVLLFVKASWCRWCRDLEHEVLSHPRVAALLEERFVTILVDKDRRPDIDARYAKGGWPTLAYLDDAGGLLAQDTYMDVEPLIERLELVADYYAKNRDAIKENLEHAQEEQRREDAAVAGVESAGPELSLAIVEAVAVTVLETADPDHGGWGGEQKFPHPEAIDFALVRWSQTGDKAMYSLVMKTLRCMQTGEIHDRVEGGFYRYATQRDWSVPHHEKMLGSNAGRLHAYLEAYQITGDSDFRKTAEGILTWMHETLLDKDLAAFRGSQDADPAYAHLQTLADRKRAKAPECDATIFTNWNAMAISALLKASVVFQDSRHTRQAEATLEFLLDRLFDERHGMYHYWDGSYHLPGLLADQAYTLKALLDVSQHTGRNELLDQAEHLASLTIEHLRAPSGGFFDTRFDPRARGGLRIRNRSILENAVMAEALVRLHHLTRKTDYLEAARETLESFVLDYKRYGHFVAGYARAVDLLFHEPVHVTVVGRRDSPETQALLQSAFSVYVASRIVQVLDPAQDREALDRFGYSIPTGSGTARAYVHRGRESYADTDDPGRLPALMMRTERG